VACDRRRHFGQAAFITTSNCSSWRNGLRCALANHVPRRWRWAQTRWRYSFHARPATVCWPELRHRALSCLRGCSPSVGCRTIFAATRNRRQQISRRRANKRSPAWWTVGKKATSWACVRRAGSARNRIPALSPDRLGTPELNQSAHHGDTDGYLSPHSAKLSPFHSYYPGPLERPHSTLYRPAILVARWLLPSAILTN